MMSRIYPIEHLLNEIIMGPILQTVDVHVLQIFVDRKN